MKKETLLEIVLGTIGGIIFAIGMCMCLVEEWNTLKLGIIVSVVGFIVLLALISIYRKEHPKKKKEINYSLVITFIVGIIGALVMGYGMSKIMTGSATSSDMIIGLITGIIGLIICILNYPVYAYLTKK